MRAALTLFACLLTGGVLAGCSSSTGKAPADGAPADGASTDLTRVDLAPGDAADSLGKDFGLLIPQGTRLCSMFSGTDVFSNLDSKGRVTFRAGLFRLPRDRTSFAADLVEKVELAPGPVEATPQSEGRFTRTIEGTAQSGYYRYELQQTFSHGQRRYELSLFLRFEVKDGAAARQVVTLDQGALIDDGSVGLSGKPQGQQYGTRYTSCGHELFNKNTVTVTVANGDELVFEIRTLIPPCNTPGLSCAGGPGMGALVQTRLVRGATERSVSDFFRQVFTAQHHTFGRSYLARFDKPVGDAHGVALLVEKPDELSYLDAGLKVVSKAVISNTTTE
jgi:hypothetical protein